MDMVTVATFRDPWNAHILCSRLHTIGIAAVVANENHVWAQWPISTALGGVRVQVPDLQADGAREVMRLAQSGEYSRQLAEELGDLDEQTCPNCGSIDLRPRRELTRVIVAILCGLFTGAIFPAIGSTYSCRDCGTKL
jgi:hypothetical protein